MSKKFISLPLSPKLYEALVHSASRKGESVERYATSLIKSNVSIDPSFAQKKTVGKTVSGQSILNHGNMVFLDGVYYRYRLKGQIVEAQKPQIQKNVVYKVTDAKGNVVVLERL